MSTGSALSLQEPIKVEQKASSIESIPGPSSITPEQVEAQMDPRERTRMLALHGRDWMFSRQQTVADLRSKLEKLHQSQSSTDLFGPKTGSISSLKSEGDEKKEEEKKEEKEDDKK